MPGIRPSLWKTLWKLQMLLGSERFSFCDLS